MRVLQITSIDDLGSQFNGYELSRHLRARGHKSDMAVALRRLNEPWIHELGAGHVLGAVNPRLCGLEARLGWQMALPATWLELPTKPWFRRAQVVHLQLPQNIPFLSLLALPWLSRVKPVVWTMHDQWLMTGHCVYAMDCRLWRSGCSPCPHPERFIPLARQTAGFNWRLRRLVMAHSQVQLVVASHWMREQVRQSPILGHLPVKVIHFGVDPKLFGSRSREECRRELGLPIDANVLAFRSTPSVDNFKGTKYIERALALMDIRRPTWLVTMEQKGGLKALRDKYNFLELGWVCDRRQMATIMGAADLFLMPSVAEAFGLMAVEAMACGTPVVCFQGTALPELIGAPGIGAAVPMRDAEALAQAVQELLGRPEELRQRAERARELVAERYTLEGYVDRHLTLYRQLIEARE